MTEKEYRNELTKAIAAQQKVRKNVLKEYPRVSENEEKAIMHVFIAGWFAKFKDVRKEKNK